MHSWIEHPYFPAISSYEGDINSTVLPYHLECIFRLVIQGTANVFFFHVVELGREPTGNLYIDITGFPGCNWFHKWLQYPGNCWAGLLGYWCEINILSGWKHFGLRPGSIPIHRDCLGSVGTNYTSMGTRCRVLFDFRVELLDSRNDGLNYFTLL